MSAYNTILTLVIVNCWQRNWNYFNKKCYGQMHNQNTIKHYKQYHAHTHRTCTTDY